MGLKAFTTIPTDIIQWSKYLSSLVVKPDPKTITDEAFANRSANSVIGRAASTIGAPSDIVAAGDGRVLIRRAGTLEFDSLDLDDLPDTVATLTDVSTAVDASAVALTSAYTAADAALEATILALSDPFPQYTTAAELTTALTPYDTRAVADTRNVLASTVLNGSATYDPPSLIDGAATSTAVTVTGAALGDFALASFSLSTQGISLSAEVTATNTVTVNFFNKTGGTLDLSSGTLKARVWK